MEAPARMGRTTGLASDDGEFRIRALRDLLAELQEEARNVFASSGETVDRFLRERRNEALAEPCVLG